MKQQINNQIKKGILDIYILYLIKTNEIIYGYDLIKNMSIYFSDVNESTFYSILRRLNKKKLTEVIIKKSDNGPVRKYYKITEEGLKCLEENIQELKILQSVINIIINS